MKNNFTNKISELQNFNLEPNKEVWVEIEKQLPQEKQRRIVAWWWGLPVILGLGFAIWVLPKSGEKEHFLSKKEEKTIILSKKNAKNAKNNEIEVVKNADISAKNTHISAKNRHIFDKNTPIFGKNTHALDKNTSTFGKNTPPLDKNTSIFDKNASTFDKNTLTLAENTLTLDKNTSTTHTDSSTSPLNKSNRIRNQSKKLTWSWAFGGGINYLSKNSLFSKSEEKMYVSNLSTGTAVSPQNNSLSLPKTGFHFNIGINGNYTLSKKSALQFGLQYHYLQNNIGLEPLPQTITFSSADLYGNGNMLTIKNTYHLLSIPVSYNYCFNPFSKNTIAVITGGSIEYSIAKNGLYINNEKGYYEKNNNELNSFFASLHTGLSFNINNKFSVGIVAKKYLTAVQKSSSKYYWQQLDVQVNIPLKLKK